MTFRKTSNLAFLLICGAVYGQLGKHNEDCSQEGILQCEQQLNDYFRTAPGFLVRISEHYEQYCSIIDETFSCMDRKFTNCIPNASDRRAVKKAVYFDSTRKMLTSTCTQKFIDSHRALIKEQCSSPYETDVIHCIREMDAVFSKPVWNMTELAQKSCCAMGSYAKCMINAANLRCSNESAAFATTQVTTLLGDHKCNHFKWDSELCWPYFAHLRSEGYLIESLSWLTISLVFVPLLF